VLRSDRCKEYTLRRFAKFYEDIGIEMHLIIGYTSQ